MQLPRFVLTLVLVAATSVASAQSAPAGTPPPMPNEAPAAVPAAAAPAPDVVHTKNGGMIRGTISEYVPGDYVVIVTITGETKRIAGEDVTYAGRANEVPVPPPAPKPAPSAPLLERNPNEVKPLVTVKGNSANITFGVKRGPKPKEPLTLYLRTGTATASAGGAQASADAFTRICTAPCAAELPEGAYTFAVGMGDRPARKVEGMQTVRDGYVLRGRYVDNKGVRVAGVLLGIAGAVIGTTLIVTSDSDAGFFGGLGLSSGSLLLGLVLGSVGDKAALKAYVVKPAQ